jgi:hypothetical protein
MRVRKCWLLTLAILSSLTICAWAELPIPKHPLWTPIVDSVYLQEIEGKVKTKDPLLAAAVLDDVLFVGTANGVLRLENRNLVPVNGPTGTVSRLKVLNAALYAFTPDALWRLSKGEWRKVVDQVIVDGCIHLDSVILVDASRIYQFDGEKLLPLDDAPSAFPILGVASYAETIYVRHADSVAFLIDRALEYDDVKDWGHLPHGSTTRDFMTLGSRLMVPTDKGVATLCGMSWRNITGKEGLCYEDTTCIAKGFEKEDYWVGTTRGAIRWVDGEFQYFDAHRWLPHDKVNAIACGDRVAYVATDGGLGIVTYEPYTLQKKAEYYERALDEWGLRRLGFVCTLRWDDKLNEWVRFISDNDAGWSCHLLNAYSYKYAVTKDPEAREKAVDIMRTLRWCEQITGIPGFPARAIAAKGEPGMLAITGSAGLPSEWNPTADGVWLWKGDTSSDEVDSHVQSTTIFYELAAKGKDKEAAREHLRRIIGHVVDNGWVLRDLDGKPTRWARWDPEYLQRPYGYEARGLNGMEALSMINAAYALTGDDKFLKAKQQLIEWGYPYEVLRQKLVFPSVTHFDDRLAFLAYYPLLTYEEDPKLRSIYRRSLERSWEVKRMENMVWFDYIYGALTGNEFDNARARKNLQEWPLDCKCYYYKNSHRADLQVPPGQFNYLGGDTKCMSARNIGPTRWCDDFMKLDAAPVAWSDDLLMLGEAIDEKAVNDPSAFIDTYWMARYYGMILPPDTKDPKHLTVEKRNVQLGAKPYDGPQRPDVGF